MNHSCGGYIQPSSMASHPEYLDRMQINPQSLLLDTLVPGFSLFSSALYKYTKIDLSIYIPAILVLGLLMFAWGYISVWFGEFVDQHLMSTADIRIDDEMYNMLMAWIANQNFAKKSRRFVANTNLNSRMWWLFDDDDNDNDADEDEDLNSYSDIRDKIKGKNKKVQFTPSFGTHYFWYKGWPLVFRRMEDTRQTGFGPVSGRENISVSSFGRNPELLKELLDDCREAFQKNDENRTIIHRGGIKAGGCDPTWTRCVSRVSRPFSTVVLDEGVKQSLLDDMSDYLNPLTKRWYSNRGIPYRRGYLLYGPPGTGKSSLSLAIAGYFKLKIYIVSLNSINEESLSSLFNDLPRQCVVLLEDIDTAGLTQPREEQPKEEEPKQIQPAAAGPAVVPTPPSTGSRISLSALLNVIDGVAASEGRILIMTTNHLEKLDEALIRPGRVDMTVKFDLANAPMITSIFRGIFATLEGDIPKSKTSGVVIRSPNKSATGLPKGESAKAFDEEKEAAILEAKRVAEEAKIFDMGTRFAEIIPAMCFSPADIQGYILKHKRKPEAAIENAAEWVRVTNIEKRKKREKEEREEKERLEKEAKEAAEAKERAEKEAAETKEKEEKEAAAKKDKEEKEKVGDEEKPKVNGVKVAD